MPRRRSPQSDLTFLGSFLLLLWVIELVDLALGLRLDLLGIRPRTIGSVLSIPLAPFLHAGVPHLVSNTIGVALFGALASFRGGKDLPSVVFYSALTSGAGIWLLGAPRTIHLGASGVVFGLFAFVLVIGFFEKRAVSVLLSIAVILIWGGLTLTLFELRPGVSWSGHLFGFAGGILAAKELRRRRW